MKTSTSHLESIVRKFPGLEIGVLGDVMLDELLRGEATRISPEAPVPVVLIRDPMAPAAYLGGSGNVAANVAALGGRAVLFGAIGGDDAAAGILETLFRERGIDARSLIRVPGRVTPRKVRIVAHQHQLLRVDFEKIEPLSLRTGGRLARSFSKRVSQLNALIISDYLKGSVSNRLSAEAIALARRQGLPVLVDPKPEHPEICRDATVVTPNLQEAERMAGVPLDTARARQSGAPGLIEKLGCDAVLITRGGDGMTLAERGTRPRDISSVPRAVYDVTGAGDTVIAVLALALAAGATLADAAQLANFAGGCVVLKFGTAVITPEELRAALRG